MNILLLLLCIVLDAVAVLPADAAPTPVPVTLSPEVVKDFEWFSGLGFPDLHDCPVARVATGDTVAYNGHPPVNQYITAFLLHEGDAGRFTVLIPDLFTRDFIATAPGTPEPQRVGFEKLPLAEAADAYLKELAGLSTDSSELISRDFGNRLAERTQVFVWAWACWRNGLDDRAARLYTYAAALPKYFHGQITEPADFQFMLEQDFSYSLLNRAKLDLGNSKIPRTRLLETFESIEQNYPRSPFTSQIHDKVAVLREMVAEDAAHAAKPVAPLADLPLDERMAELIFRLRDENWRDDVYSGTAADLAGKEKSPSDLLVAIGFPAVPQLIAAFDDHRLSRTTIDDSNFGALLSHVLTVGECAQNTLARIAGRNFYPTPSQSSSQLAEEWWKEHQQKGDRQTLIDAVSQGRGNVSSQARLLQERFPDEALASIIQGAKNSDNAVVRADLVMLAGGVAGDDVMPFLKEEMQTGPDLSTRLAAARALWQHGDVEEAATAMISEWKTPRSTDKDEDGWQDQKREDLISFLTGCERVNAVEALGHNLLQKSVEERLDVVMAVDPNRMQTNKGMLDGPGQRTGDRKAPQSGTDEESKVNAAAVAVLAAELEDTEKRTGMSGSYLSKDFRDPRVCDIAGEILAEHFPGKYVFDLSAPWRSATGNVSPASTSGAGTTSNRRGRRQKTDMKNNKAIRGLWWVDGEGKDPKPGTLVIKPNSITLSVWKPENTTIDEMMRGAAEDGFRDVQRVIDGTDGDGKPITLFGCGVNNYLISGGLKSWEIGALAAVKGMKIDTWHHAISHAVRIEMEYLHRWLNRPLTTQVFTENKQLSLTLTPPLDTEFPLEPGVRIRFVEHVGPSNTDDEQKIMARSSIWFQFDRPQSLHDITDKWQPWIRSFFGLLVGVTTNDTSVEIFPADPYDPNGTPKFVSGTLHMQRGKGRGRRGAEAPDSRKMVATFNLIGDRLGSVVSEWHRMYSELRPVVELFSTVAFHQPLYDEARFLFLVQAFEIYHSRSSKFVSHEVPREQHQKLLEEAEKHLPAHMWKWAEGKLRMNFCSLKTKLLDLFNEHLAESTQIFGDVALAASRIAYTRNFLIHRSEDVKPNRLMSENEIGLAGWQLEALLWIILLREIGLDGAPVARVLRRVTGVMFVNVAE